MLRKEFELARFRRALFGVRSERVTPEELALPGLDLGPQNDTAPPVEPKSSRTGKVKARTRTRRRARLELAPACVTDEHVVLDPESTTCACCGAARVPIGEETRTVVEREPARYRRVTTHRRKLACGACKQNSVSIAPPPEPLSTGAGPVGATLAVDTVVAHSHARRCRANHIPSKATRCPSHPSRWGLSIGYISSVDNSFDPPPYRASRLRYRACQGRPHGLLSSQSIKMKGAPMDDAFVGVRDVSSPYGPSSEPLHGGHPTTLEARTGIQGRSAAITLLREQIVRFAKTTAIVVIRGETGTGKELVAKALHTLSPRAHAPFVAANVAALTESLLQSELFGHERGAFTGATYRHKGLFEQAHGGTLFLDEIGELSMEAQASLLRVLETREVRPVGGERARRVDVRLVVATHRPLAEMVDRNLFREDLFYRLHMLVVRIPPLRHRVNDLPFLARHVLGLLAPEVGDRRIDGSGLQALGEYGWPGNVRQFQNVLRRAVIETDDPVLSREHIRAALAHEVGADREKRDGATVATILAALDAENWNINRAAKSLGLPRSTLRTKIRRAGLVRGG